MTGLAATGTGIGLSAATGFGAWTCWTAGFATAGGTLTGAAGFAAEVLVLGGILGWAAFAGADFEAAAGGAFFFTAVVMATFLFARRQMLPNSPSGAGFPASSSD